MKKITVIWTIVLLTVFSCLTIIAFEYKKVIKYKKLEQNMVVVAKEYVKTKKIKINKTNIELETLIDFDKSLMKLVVDKCDGKVEVKKKAINIYKAKIKCDNYKTK